MSPLPALAAEGGVAAGTLTCNVAGGWGFIFGSSKDVQCTFEGLGRTTERYAGAITKFGVDIGYSGAGVMVWGVVAPTVNVASGSLDGSYAGATGGAAAGVGVGANVLVGGLNNSIALQPVSIEGRTGLNVAAGIGALTLKSNK
ncbi:MAG: DUF992 domain-containing protein [Chloroflexota bacterium]